VKEILDEIEAEIDRQINLFGVQDHVPAIYHVILAEEFGEVSKEVENLTFNKAPNPNVGKAIAMRMRHELVQVAAVAASFIASLDRRYPEGDK